MDERDLFSQKKLTRREFLKLAGITAASAVASSCLPRPPEAELAQEAKGVLARAEIKIRLGDEERVALPGLQWVPDGHISMLRKAGEQLKMWVSAGPRSFLLEGKSLETLGSPQLALEPERVQTEKGFQGYRSLHSVAPGASPGELIGFYHQEHWPNASTYFPFTASVGIARSTNGGASWEDEGIIIQGKNPAAFAGERPAVSGAGQPSAIVIEDQVFLYYVDWNGQEVDAIHLARARIDSVGKPQAWQKWTGEGFGRFGEEKTSAPVISPPTDHPNTLWASLPGISYNRHLQEFVATFETNMGFYLASSKDAIHWGNPRTILEFPQLHSQRKRGDVWLSYPTFLSLDSASDRETSRSGYLYFSKGVWEQEPHFMFRRPLELS